MKLITQLQKEEINRCILLVAKYYELTVEDLLSSSRDKSIPDAKAIAMKYIVESLDLPANKVIKELGLSVAMSTYYYKKLDNKHDLLPIYEDFLKFIKNKDINYLIADIKDYEIRLKVEFIKRTIEKKFKTIRFKKAIEGQLFELVYALDKRDREMSIISLYSWMNDFDQEFTSNEIKEQFESIGK